MILKSIDPSLLVTYELAGIQYIQGSGQEEVVYQEVKSAGVSTCEVMTKPNG